MNRTSKFISGIYAIMLIVGGFIGYIKAGSEASLITGLLSALIIFLALNMSRSKPKDSILFIGATSLALFAFFIKRYAYSHTFMPGGLMAILSIICLVTTTISFLNLKHKS